MNDFNDTSEDEIVTVQLPRKDVKILRGMINTQKGVAWAGKRAAAWIVLIGALTTVVTFWDSIKKLLVG